MTVEIMGQLSVPIKRPTKKADPNIGKSVRNKVSGILIQ